MNKDLYFNTLKLFRVASRFYDFHLKDFGINCRQFFILSQLSANCLSITELSKTLCADRTTISRAVKNLVKNGLVNTESLGKRKRVCSLTPMGEDILSRSLDYWNNAHEATMNIYTFSAIDGIDYDSFITNIELSALEINDLLREIDNSEDTKDE